MNLERIITNDVKRNQKGKSYHNEKIGQWSNLQDRACKIFAEASSIALRENHPFRLYCSKTNEQVQLTFSSELTNFHTLNEQPSLQNQVNQEGATLVISLDITGRACVIIYPFKSERLRRLEEQVILKVYETPCAVSETEILKSIKIFLVYSRSSNMYTSSTIFERLYINWIVYKDVRNTGERRKAIIKNINDWSKTIVVIVSAWTLAYVSIVWKIG